MTHFRAIILAAGKGTRMKSDLPKVLHPIAGRPMIDYVLGITRALRSLKTYMVVGHGANDVKAYVGSEVNCVLQDKLLGTADAVMRCAGQLKNYTGTVLILCGDTPLLGHGVVRALLNRHQHGRSTATFLTATIDNPQGYGRILRDAKGSVIAIREQKDASADEQRINEINVGVYCFQATALFKALGQVKLNPKKKEYYLTDVIELLLAAGNPVATVRTDDGSVAFGVNTREDLAQAEAVIRRRILTHHMANGVTIVDPLTTYIEADVHIGQDTVIYPMSVIHADVHVGKNCRIGPFARLRPGTRVGNATEIGNFTEVSRSTLGQKVFMKHFSFLGDAQVGAAVNIGAGAITANFDGKQKNMTEIGEGAFIGSDVVLVAPVKVGARAMIGAGSVVTKGKRIPPGSRLVGVPARIIKS